MPQSTHNKPSGEAGEIYLLLVSLNQLGLMEMQLICVVAISETVSFLKLIFLHNIHSLASDYTPHLS